MEIMKREWASLTEYDEKLRQIDLYKKHPTMLPFVGYHYPDTKILILGESHYLDPNENEDAKKNMKHWYHMPTEQYHFQYPNYFDTRSVVGSYLTLRRSKAHSMFREPAKALIEAWDLLDVNDSEAFTAFAFMNYFQRPEVSSGKTIALTEEDKDQAFAHLNKVVQILEPVKVVFLSKKSFDAYASALDPRISYTNHPTSKHWNGPNGKEKLIDIFKKCEEYHGFSTNGHLTEADILPTMKDYVKIEKNHRRFIKDKTTYSCYPGAEPDSVNEIVWHIVEGGTRLGIGYVVERKLLWLWDYSEKRYLSEDDLPSFPGLRALHSEVQALIQSWPSR